MWKVLVTVVMLAMAQAAQAQTMYNPSFLSFESTDHARATTYSIEVLGETTDTVLFSFVVPASVVLVEPDTAPQRYSLLFSVFPSMPVGKSYRFQMRINAENDTSPVSNITPEKARFSTCVVGSAVKPLEVTLGVVPTLTVGQYATVTVTITAPAPVHVVMIDLVTDGQPAFSFVSKEDLRSTKPYVVGPFVRPLTSFLTLEAADEGGCRTTVTPQMVTVVSGG